MYIGQIEMYIVQYVYYFLPTLMEYMLIIKQNLGIMTTTINYI